MHTWTGLKPESQDKTGLGLYPDAMVEHDAQIGRLLKKLDDLGIVNNTIVIYTTAPRPSSGRTAAPRRSAGTPPSFTAKNELEPSSQ
jgi:hypothetical protein